MPTLPDAFHGDPALNPRQQKQHQHLQQQYNILRRLPPTLSIDSAQTITSRELTVQEKDSLNLLNRLKEFLATAPSRWCTPDAPNNIPFPNPQKSAALNRFSLPSGEYITCVLWQGYYHITGTDIVRALVFRFEAFGRPVRNMKKFEEGVFSDLRNLKPGVDACLEDPKSSFLDLLYKYQCIRTQKKQKVFYWFSVPHDRLFLDALERDLKREKAGIEPATTVMGEPALSFQYDGSSNKSLWEDWIQKIRDAKDSGQLQPEDPTVMGYSGVGEDVPLSAPSSSMEAEASTQAANNYGGMLELFEGSPTYKQRRKKRSPGAVQPASRERARELKGRASASEERDTDDSSLGFENSGVQRRNTSTQAEIELARRELRQSFNPDMHTRAAIASGTFEATPAPLFASAGPSDRVASSAPPSPPIMDTTYSSSPQSDSTPLSAGSTSHAKRLSHGYQHANSVVAQMPNSAVMGNSPIGRNVHPSTHSSALPPTPTSLAPLQTTNISASASATVQGLGQPIGSANALGHAEPTPASMTSHSHKSSIGGCLPIRSRSFGSTSPSGITTSTPISRYANQRNTQYNGNNGNQYHPYSKPTTQQQPHSQLQYPQRGNTLPGVPASTIPTAVQRSVSNVVSLASPTEAHPRHTISGISVQTTAYACPLPQCRQLFRLSEDWRSHILEHALQGHLSHLVAEDPNPYAIELPNRAVTSEMQHGTSGAVPIPRRSDSPQFAYVPPTVTPPNHYGMAPPSVAVSAASNSPVSQSNGSWMGSRPNSAVSSVLAHSPTSAYSGPPSTASHSPSPPHEVIHLPHHQMQSPSSVNFQQVSGQAYTSLLIPNSAGHQMHQTMSAPSYKQTFDHSPASSASESFDYSSNRSNISRPRSVLLDGNRDVGAGIARPHSSVSHYGHDQGHMQYLPTSGDGITSHSASHVYSNVMMSDSASSSAESLARPMTATYAGMETRFGEAMTAGYASSGDTEEVAVHSSPEAEMDLGYPPSDQMASGGDRYAPYHPQQANPAWSTGYTEYQKHNTIAGSVRTPLDGGRIAPIHQVGMPSVQETGLTAEEAIQLFA